jgi:rhodanese-related sulfurtransferase
MTYAEFDDVLQLAGRRSASDHDVFLIDARPKSSYQDGHIPTSLLLDFPSSLLHDPAGFTYLRAPSELSDHISVTLGQDVLEKIISHKGKVINSKSDFSVKQTLRATIRTDR